LVKLAQLSSINEREFNAWFHGQISKAAGPGKPWNATTYLSASRYLEGTVYSYAAFLSAVLLIPSNI
jgi:hypothetical protein